MYARVITAAFVAYRDWSPSSVSFYLSALEVFHDYALYKFTIDIDIDIT